MAKKKVNSRLAYGLCKRYGVKLPEDAPPRVAWEMLKKATGITLMDAYTDQKYKDELEKPTSLYDCNNSEDECEYPDSRKQIESRVFEKISTYRQELRKFGEVIIPVITYNGTYKVKLYNADEDYEFEIISFEEK